MNPLFQPSPSVGGLVKKILDVNPGLGTTEIAQIIRQATRNRGKEAGDFAAVQVIDEELALKLAQESTSPTPAARELFL